VFKRYLEPVIQNHLAKYRQMAFLMGPRQVGKTTLALSLLSSPQESVNYFNWDNPLHRKILLTQIFNGKMSLKNSDQSVLVFDEIHKYPRWKNTLKGLFDTCEPQTHWIVTGSSALNVYRKGQDSLMGRYFSYYLCPLSVAEILDQGVRSKFSVEELFNFTPGASSSEAQESFEQLFELGGFPEPFFKGEKNFLFKWRTSRLDRLINQDLASTEQLRQLKLVEHLMFLLPERVGSPLSLNNLREDLEVHFATVKHWLDLLERVFYGFKIYPYSERARGRMLKKEIKWYLWDWSEIEDPGIRFENMMAVHLLKYVYYLNDLGLGEFSLHYIRDREKREVDFLICQKRKPWIAIECKLSADSVPASLVYYGACLQLKKSFLITREGKRSRSYRQQDQVIEHLPASEFLRVLV